MNILEFVWGVPKNEYFAKKFCGKLGFSKLNLIKDKPLFFMFYLKETTIFNTYEYLTCSYFLTKNNHFLQIVYFLRKNEHNIVSLKKLQFRILLINLLDYNLNSMKWICFIWCVTWHFYNICLRVEYIFLE